MGRFFLVVLFAMLVTSERSEAAISFDFSVTPGAPIVQFYQFENLYPTIPESDLFLRVPFYVSANITFSVYGVVLPPEQLQFARLDVYQISGGYISGHIVVNACNESDFHCGRYDLQNSSPYLYITKNIDLIGFAISYQGPSPIDVSLTFDSGTRFLITAVPEPSTWAMLLIGFAGIGFMAHRKRRVLSAI
jgi:hypothetical protein